MIDPYHILVGLGAVGIGAGLEIFGVSGTTILSWWIFLGFSVGWEMCDQEYRMGRIQTHHLPLAPWRWHPRHVLDLLSFQIGAALMIILAVVFKVI